MGWQRKSLLVILKVYLIEHSVGPERPSCVNPEIDFCIICQANHENENVRTLDCQYEYRAECLKKWLLLKNICPHCKLSELYRNLGWTWKFLQNRLCTCLDRQVTYIVEVIKHTVSELFSIGGVYRLPSSQLSEIHISYFTFCYDVPILFKYISWMLN